MRTIPVTPSMDVLPLGRLGENERTQIVFDVSEWLEEYPGASFSMTNKLPHSSEGYPCTLTSEGDGIYSWTITSAELTTEGDGECQLQAVKGDVVVKGKIYKTKIGKALDGTAEVPDPWESWITELTELQEAAEDAAEDADDAASDAEAYAVGKRGGTDVESSDPAYHNNSKYYSEQAESSATAAAGSATTASNKASDAEAYAIGKRGGQDVGSSDPAYHNNSKYYAEQASAAISPKANRSVVAKEYADLTFPVTKGTWCFHDGVLYEANQAISTSETWTAAHWTELTVEAAAQSLLSEISAMDTATESDVGKALSPKTVSNGKVTEWQYKSISGGGGSVDVDDTLTQSGEAADAKVTGDLIFGLTEIVKSKNLYNKVACNPQNGKWYKPDGTGVVEDSDNYAITGKMPVEAQTKYAFSTGGLANIKRVFFFKGDSGETYISNTQYTGKTSVAFETPALCTFIGFSLFAASHTSQQYSAAIDKCMLELGTYSTDFVPYSETRKVSTDKLVDETAVEGAANVIIETPLINWFDKSQVLDNKYFNNSYHEIYDSTSYAFSGLIPVKPNTQYNISCDKDLAVGEMASYYEEWDESRTFIQRSNQNGAFGYISQIHTGATTKYISINLSFGAAHTTEQLNALLDSIMLVEGTQVPASYVPYKVEAVADHNKLDNMYQLNMDAFRGKTWLVCGTSVSYADSHVFTGGLHEGEVCRGYIGNVARRKPMIVTNEGVSGSTLADTTQDSALINRYQSLGIENYDFISIEYGINDFGRDIPVGSASDAAGTTSFAACLKTIIEYILTENPTVGLIICTEPDVRGTTQNNNNNTLKEYTDVTLAIAEQYRLPVCDWYYKSGINAMTKGSTSVDYLTADGTHPSVYGHMRMGAMLNQVFDSLLC